MRARLPMAALVILGVVLFTALSADVVAPRPPNMPSLPDRLRPPAWSADGSAEYLLGTDSQGRDVLSQIVYGSRVSVIVGLGAVMLSGLVGLIVGLIAGYRGGLLGIALMRLVDMMLAIPILLVAILFSVALGPSMTNVIIAISILLWARFARVVRGDALALREREYVVAARAVGATPLRVVARHVLPNLVNTFLVVLSAQLGWVILTEASLSFLGAGVPAPSVSWGAMVAEGRNYVTSAPWISFFPGLAIVLLVVSINQIGDWLRDQLDPHLRNTRLGG